MKHRNLIIILTGFIAGIVAGSYADFGGAFASLFILLGLVFFLIFRVEKKRVFLFLFLFFIAGGFGVLRYALSESQQETAALENKEGEKISLTAIVTGEPEARESYTRLVVESGGTKILVYADRYPKINYGDKIVLTGNLKEPKNFSGNFNWEEYLAKDDIFFEMFYPRVEIVSSGNGGGLKRFLFKLKNNFMEAVSESVPEPHAAFLGGLTIGARDSIPEDLKKDFNTTGMTHIVALSGYNVTIIADNIMRIFSFLPRYFGMSAGAMGVVAFALMTGASATTVRASIMALMAVLARATGRIYAITWALFLAGFFMIVQNPKILRFNTSFQLSFLATLGLIYISPTAEKYLKFAPKKFRIRETMSATISAQIAVLPLLVYKIGTISLISLPVNLLVLPFVPITMFFGFLTGLVGMISGILSMPFGWVSFAFLQYEIFIIKLFAKIPYASISVAKFSVFFTAISYAIIALWIYNDRKNKQSGGIKKI